ncbi:MAG: hypothetical protein IT200_10320 [Thermoleophilia bacterium]|nr:hypothetical protein [Thermoleophilia bacterium]
METVDSIVFWLLVLGFLASLGLAVPVASGVLTVRRSPFVLAAGLLAAGVAWMPVYARAADRYFVAGDTSRWEYAARDGRGTMIVAFGALAVVALCVAAAAALSGPRSVWRRAAMAATLGGTFALLAITILLGIGH